MAECQNFEQFGLAPNLLSAIKRMGYTKPTAIQCKAIPVVLQGRDVMGAAQTGTGKTASFGLPVLQKLLPLANTFLNFLLNQGVHERVNIKPVFDT